MSGLTQCRLCQRQPADGLPAPTYMSVHDSERQDDTLFRWFGIGRNNSHTDLPVVHRRQPVPACFIYERLMNRYPLRSVTPVNWPRVPVSASPCRALHNSNRKPEVHAVAKNLVEQPEDAALDQIKDGSEDVE